MYQIAFKTMFIRILKELRGRMEELSENLRYSKHKKEHRNHKKEPDKNEEYNN